MSAFDVVFTIDKAYHEPLCCSLSSLLATNAQQVDRIFVIHNSESASASSFRKISTYIASSYQKEIESIVIDDSRFQTLHLDFFFSPAIYYRLCLADFLPDNVDSVLFLDPDIIITSPLELIAELRFLPTDDLYCYAVDHGYSLSQQPWLVKFHQSWDSYFNAGVIYFNVKLMRNQKVSEAMMKFAKEYLPELKYLDQDILNIIFYGKWKPLPYSYNAYDIKHKLDQLPKVIHYTGNRKPWNYFCDHPYKDNYWEVLKQTPFNKFVSIKRLLSSIITQVLLPIASLKRK